MFGSVSCFKHIGDEIESKRFFLMWFSSIFRPLGVIRIIFHTICEQNQSKTIRIIFLHGFSTFSQPNYFSLVFLCLLNNLFGLSTQNRPNFHVHWFFFYPFSCHLTGSGFSFSCCITIPIEFQSISSQFNFFSGSFSWCFNTFIF